jgi:SrtB family sortase
MPKHKMSKNSLFSLSAAQARKIAFILVASALLSMGVSALQGEGMAAPADMPEKASFLASIKAYKAVNDDVKGWIKIPGTNIDYPVLHDARILSTGSPHFYLDRDLYKKTSRIGVIYASPPTVFGTQKTMSQNTVLFGHNWTNYSAYPRIGNANDVMFAQLTAFHHLDFAKKHPYIYYSTADEDMVWIIFAAFYTDVSFDYINPDPAGDEIVKIINGARLRSRHIYGVDMKTDDKLLTLSTCTRAYGKSANQRFVVMARLLRADERIEDISITANPKPVLPKL